LSLIEKSVLLAGNHIRMNILAHIYLSGASDEVKVGNFIGDYVKGRKYNKFPEAVSQGIRIHRDIDDYTDKHPVVQLSKSLLYSDIHKYSGVIVDVIYDHYLARDWARYSPVNQDDFINNLYLILKRNIDILPAEVQEFLPRFIKNNWLSYYKDVEGIIKVIRQMILQIKNPVDGERAVEVFIARYHDFEAHFNQYFPQLAAFIFKKYGFNKQELM